MDEAADPRYGGRLHVLAAVPPDELLDWVVDADVGVMPIQTSTLNHYLSTPNKLFECLAGGRAGGRERLPGDAPDRPRRSRRSARACCAGPTIPPTSRAAIRRILELPPDASGRPAAALPRGRPRALELGDRVGDSSSALRRPAGGRVAPRRQCRSRRGAALTSERQTAVPQRAVLVLPTTAEFDSRTYRIASALVGARARRHGPRALAARACRRTRCIRRATGSGGSRCRPAPGLPLPGPVLPTDQPAVAAAPRERGGARRGRAAGRRRRPSAPPPARRRRRGGPTGIGAEPRAAAAGRVASARAPGAAGVAARLDRARRPLADEGEPGGRPGRRPLPRHGLHGHPGRARPGAPPSGAKSSTTPATSTSTPATSPVCRGPRAPSSGGWSAAGRVARTGSSPSTGPTPRSWRQRWRVELPLIVLNCSYRFDPPEPPAAPLPRGARPAAATRGRPLPGRLLARPRDRAADRRDPVGRRARPRAPRLRRRSRPSSSAARPTRRSAGRAPRPAGGPARPSCSTGSPRPTSSRCRSSPRP